eukprot:TRINITY_DN14817_c0_g1_i1.p2 TRINITY_DN14817_c0_g1~~TRINITY_DN14817_c0_g1_i1.p2  ORF type:complete len:115 (+),score=29.57 TRINITY_DN14817_c0_g1_i1:58-402(+)
MADEKVTLEHVLALCKEDDFDVAYDSKQDVWIYLSAGGVWRDKAGNEVKNWKGFSDARDKFKFRFGRSGKDWTAANRITIWKSYTDYFPFATVPAHANIYQAQLLQEKLDQLNK